MLSAIKRIHARAKSLKEVLHSERLSMLKSAEDSAFFNDARLALLDDVVCPYLNKGHSLNDIGNVRRASIMDKREEAIVSFRESIAASLAEDGIF